VLGRSCLGRRVGVLLGAGGCVALVLGVAQPLLAELCGHRRLGGLLRRGHLRQLDLLGQLQRVRQTPWARVQPRDIGRLGGRTRHLRGRGRLRLGESATKVACVAEVEEGRQRHLRCEQIGLAHRPCGLLQELQDTGHFLSEPAMLPPIRDQLLHQVISDDLLRVTSSESRLEQLTHLGLKFLLEGSHCPRVVPLGVAHNRISNEQQVLFDRHWIFRDFHNAIDKTSRILPPEAASRGYPRSTVHLLFQQSLALVLGGSAA